MNETLRPILVAEDETSDAMILELAFRKAKLPDPLVIVRDGCDAVDFLEGNGRYADRSGYQLPRLIVLDLKMPKMSGFELLEWLSAQREIKDIPAVVLSSSADPSDIQKAKRLGASEYFVKPHSFEKLIAVVQEIHARWLNEPNIGRSGTAARLSMDASAFPVKA